MATKIEWTDATWNPTTGCDKVSAGCKNCYAERMAKRLKAMGNRRYKDGFKLTLHEDLIEAPLRWRKPRMVFVNSMSDVFHEDVPFEFIDKVFAVMALCPQHTFQILTKRAERMRDYLQGCEVYSEKDDLVLGDTAIGNIINGLTGNLMMEYQVFPGGEDKWDWQEPMVDDSMDAPREICPGHFDWHDGSYSSPIPWPLPNVWLGVSVEDGQRHSYDRLDALKETPAAVRFVSLEPLLEGVSIRERYGLNAAWLNWVIIGGESGPGARPFNLHWAKSVIGEGKQAGIPVFVKQVGANAYSDRGGYRFKTKHPKGGDPSEWPEDLRVREMPGTGGDDAKVSLGEG